MKVWHFVYPAKEAWESVVVLQDQGKINWCFFMLFHCHENLCNNYLPQQQKSYNCEKKK